MSDLSRLSLNTATCKLATLPECVDAAVSAGYGAIGPWRDRVQEYGVERSAALIRDAGLRVSALCRGGFLTSGDPDVIAAALADNKAAIDEAATLGTRELVMVVGGLPASFASMGLAHTDADSRDKDVVAARRRMTDRIADLVPYAVERGVRLALEPMHPLFTADRGVLTTMGQSLDLARDFPAEAVGVVVDTYHVWWDPDLRASIERAGREGRISSYQICDWVLPLAANSLNSRGFPGDGYIDFPTISTWVAQTGYTGDVEVEIFNEDIWAMDPSDSLARVGEGYTELVLPHL